MAGDSVGHQIDPREWGVSELGAASVLRTRTRGVGLGEGAAFIPLLPAGMRPAQCWG